MKPDIEEMIARNSKLAAACLAVFLLGVPAGYASYDRVEGFLLPVINELKDMIAGKTGFETAVNIFLNNYRVSLYLLSMGTLILPVFIIMFSNGFLVGFVIKYLELQDRGFIFFVKGIALHGIFEMPAFFIAGAFGLRIGLSFVTLDGRKRAASVSQSIREAAAIQILVVTPLLLLAAFTEAYVSSALVR